MGRRNKSYSKDLHQQAYERLKGMHAFGESKRAAVADGTEKDKIFSYNTYKSYWKHTKYFIKYIKEKHPECTTLKSARKYVNEWLQSRADQGLSAWTVQLEAKALGKLYGIQPDDENYFKPPKRNRGDIKRSRGDRVRDRHFSKTNNDELIKFCRGTGLRRSELGELRGKDLVTRRQIEKEITRLEAIPEDRRTPADEKRLTMHLDTRLFQGEYFTFVRNGKGGRARLSPIIGKNMEQIVEGELEKERQESAYQRGLNKNLLRIARERANADRKLKPKKEHTGYFVAFTGEKEYRFKKDRRQWGRALLWETILQSPYSVDFPEEQARKQIKEDFFEQMADGSWMIARLGFDTFFDGRFERLVEREDWESKYKMKNVLLRPDLKLRAGFRSGYWEVIILHTKALGIVPPVMRAQ